MTRLFALIRRYRATFAVGVLAVIFAKGLSLAIPQILRLATDAIEAGAVDAIPSLAVGLIAVALVSALMRVASRVFIYNSARRVEFDLRTAIFRHLSSLEPSFFGQTPIGDVMNRTVADVQQMRFLMGPGLLNITNTALVYLVVLPVLLYEDAWLTLYCLSPLTALVVLSRMFAPHLYALSRRIQESMSDIATMLEENLRGAMTVRVYCREATEEAAFVKLSDEQLRLNMRSTLLTGIFQPLLGLSGAAATVALLYLGGRQMIAGQMTIGQFVQFSAYLGFLIWPTIALGYLIHSLQRSRSAADRVEAMFDTRPLVVDGPLQPDGPLGGDLEVRNLTFTYPEAAEPTLKDVTARFASGSLVVIVGRIGSGKSTLLEALARLVDIPADAIFVDDQDVTTLPVDHVRSAIAYAPQDSFLFSRTLRDNVAFGRPDSSDEQVAGAVDRAALATDVAGFVDGLQTVVGERGITLSGGQRQRTALARALLLEPRILLLDDTLAAVDVQTESQILQVLEQRKGDRTTILVTHRLGCAALADHIIVLDEGAVAEEGTEAELLAADGLYANLHRKQGVTTLGATPSAGAKASTPEISAQPETSSDAATPERTVVRDRDLVRRLWPFVVRYWQLMAITLVALPVGSALQLVQPYLIKVAIDDYVVQRQLDGFGMVVVGYVFAVIADYAVRLVRGYASALLGQRAVRDLRTTLFRKLQQVDLSYLERNPVGRLMTIVIDDVEALLNTFSSGLTGIIADLVTLIGIVAMMLVLDWRLALYAFVLVPPLCLFVVKFRPHARAAFRGLRERLSELNAFLNEALAGMPVVQAFRQQDRVRQDFDGVSLAYRDAAFRTIRYDAALYAVIEAVSTIAIATLLLFGVGLFDRGAVEIGVFVAFIDYLRRFFTPLTQLASKFTFLQSAMASAERCVALMDHEIVVANPPDPVPTDAGRQVVRFENVAFGYRTDTPILHDISFSIAPAEKVALVGVTGAGKSTIVKLLARFYDPIRGRVSLGDIDVRDLDLRALRQRMAIVLQDAYLFDDTVRSNVTLRRTDIDDDVLRRAAERSRAQGVIDRLPEGWATRIGVRGTRLSFGERQLIAFARALAYDAQILILDEATSAVDPDTEADLQRALEVLLKDRTALIIAHRLSTLRLADRILVLDKGRVVEQGTHDALLAQGGVYARLHQLQVT